MGFVARRHYHSELRSHLIKRVAARDFTEAQIDGYSVDVMQRQYDTAFLDYVRYVAGAMWGATTPESCADFASRQLINHGMHKR